MQADSISKHPSTMSEVLHCDPIDVHEEQSRDQGGWQEAAIVLIIFNLVQDAVSSVGHQPLADYEGVNAESESKHGAKDQDYAKYPINSI